MLLDDDIIKEYIPKTKQQRIFYYLPCLGLILSYLLFMHRNEFHVNSIEQEFIIKGGLLVGIIAGYTIASWKILELDFITSILFALFVHFIAVFLLAICWLASQQIIGDYNPDDIIRQFTVTASIGYWLITVASMEILFRIGEIGQTLKHNTKTTDDDFTG